MRAILKPLPVLYTCQGCAQFGQAARDAGKMLDHAGVAETMWLGAGRDLRPTSRFPIFALDGCDQACARRWLERHGIAAERSYVLAEHAAGSARRAAQRIAAELGARNEQRD
jgi:uncharacterized metal-binding protein